MEVYGKRIIMLRRLYEEKGVNLGTFMDKSGFSLKYTAYLLDGKYDSMNDEELKAFAKGVDMNVEELRTYLELSDFF